MGSAQQGSGRGERVKGERRGHRALQGSTQVASSRRGNLDRGQRCTGRWEPTCDAGGGTPGLSIPFGQAIGWELPLSELAQEGIGINGGPPCAGGGRHGGTSARCVLSIVTRCREAPASIQECKQGGPEPQAAAEQLDKYPLSPLPAYSPAGMGAGRPPR